MTKFIRVDGKLVNPKHQAKPEKRLSPEDMQKIINRAHLNTLYPSVQIPNMTLGSVGGQNCFISADYSTGVIADG